MQKFLFSPRENLSHNIVTCDVNKAVTMAERILVMNNDPGRIREDIRVYLPRPEKREKSDILFFSRKLY